MTAPTIACFPWCSTPGHHPDNHCVETGVNIADLYERTTSVAAYADTSAQRVGVYVGSLLFRPEDARAYAAALLNAADVADEALAVFNGEVPR